MVIEFMKRNWKFRANSYIFILSNPSAGGYWSTKGCVVHKSNTTHTVCHCNHLTDFAVLFRVSKTKKVNTQIYY